MPHAAATCAVCRQSRTRGSSDESGEVFICVGCQADAEQLLEIQDAIGKAARDVNHVAERPHQA